MVKSNDAVLVLMQHTASSSDPFTDLPAHVALVSSFLFWIHSDFVNHDNITFCFIHLIINPEYFTASDVRIARKLSVCEATVRTYRKPFKLLFLEYYSEYQNLPENELIDGLPFLYTRLRHFFSVPAPPKQKKLSLSSVAMTYLSSLYNKEAQ